MKFLLFIAILCSTLLSHGLFYSAHEGKAIIINANFSQKVPAAYAGLVIYDGDSAIPLLNARFDSNGNFAFLPPKAGEYKIKIIANTDHGSHEQEFSLNVGEGLNLSDYKEPTYQKYLAILSVIGIIFGLFGVIVLIKTKRA